MDLGAQTIAGCYSSAAMAGDVKAFCTAKTPMIIFCIHLFGDNGKVAIMLKAMHPDPPSHLRTCPPIPVEGAQRQGVARLCPPVPEERAQGLGCGSGIH